MRSQEALDLIKNAIDKISPDYLYYGRKWENQHVERCFAYELYHQWSIELENHMQSHPDEKKLYLNGEIPKKVVGCENSYPDLVLHGGQDITEEITQIIVCEIKRHSNSNKDAIVHDLYKLIKFKDLCHNGNSAKYEGVVFIMIGCSLDKMKNLIKKSLKKSQNNDEVAFILDSNYKSELYCMAVYKDVKNLVSEICLLNEITN